MYIYKISARGFGARRCDGGVQCPLGRQVGLPAWPAGPAWACLGLSTAFLGLSTACLGLQGASWTPSGRKLDAKLDCQNGCQAQQNALPPMLLSLYSDRFTLVSIYMYIYMYSQGTAIGKFAKIKFHKIW